MAGGMKPGMGLGDAVGGGGVAVGSPGLKSIAEGVSGARFTTDPKAQSPSLTGFLGAGQPEIIGQAGALMDMARAMVVPLMVMSVADKLTNDEPQRQAPPPKGPGM